ncbi:MAG: prepilin peptidase [Candidatus Pacebacteria bacterium CG_4_9_14_3_um_filter_40_12]|nr:prepilin peptidase [Candidatus Paceibacterota bacterium]PIR64254.1 MAG: prepilin peptidase [Candidatus Pacebacteria bacterium CG10_big_fil_rev_8_21_14_0_10_40_26]PIZ79075.1 MAG: prepilin peptidase [Candidatus Pacebacteria bacterium CG_4_10_14_0_2_um_filter_40_20]PJA69237.1 MAG: prepilin peptidase [Candidatus Pacebacteria bacterium CG_4_9_14_3_um_filter_40_12]PJC42041.1 MAG: prepilin peptidase [Candidatus Pacebacteria bacterium CG_4_9_14_0_2_um_filter_40_15]
MALLTFLLPALFIFLLGIVFGSFLNVVIVRSIRDESWVTGRSHCDICGKTIAWYDNIPLLSYLVLGGRCRHCKEAIAISHPIVEGLTGVLFLWWYIGFSLFFKLTQEPFVVLQPLFWLAVAAILIVIFFTDILVFLIPDKAVIALSALVVVYQGALLWAGIMQPLDFLYSVLGMVGAVLFFFSLWYFTRGRGLGFGDVKLIAPLSLLMGWPSLIIGLFASFIVGAVVGIGFVLVGKKKMKQPIPFGPFLIIGTVIGLLWGHEIFAWYLTFIL